MKLFGVLGDPVSHSLSPVMHNAAFKALGMDCEYHAFKVSTESYTMRYMVRTLSGLGD